MKTLTLVRRLGQPSAEELDRRRPATNGRAFASTRLLNSDMLDERAIVAARTASGSAVRKLRGARAGEVTRAGRRYDAIVSWGETFGLPLAALLKSTGARTPHVALFS